MEINKNQKTIELIQKLKSDIEYEEMMYEIGEKHPTYTKQFSRGQQNVMEKIRSKKEELATIEELLN